MYYIYVNNNRGLIDNCFYFDICNNSANLVSPHTHSFHEIVFVRKGILRHFINGTYFDITENTLFFIRNTDKHSYENFNVSNSYCEWMNFAFNDEDLQNILSYFQNDSLLQRLFSPQYPPQVLLSSYDKNVFIEKFKKLHTYNLNPSKEKKYEVRLFLFEVLTKYFLGATAPQTEGKDWFHSLISAMMKYENFTRGYPRLLELCPKSKATLQRAIQKEYGVSATEFCNNLRLAYVSQQLLVSNTPISDIFFNAGFFNLSYAYKLFRKKYGVSPTTYRKSQTSQALPTANA